MEPDFDLRPRFQYIDTNKYDVSSCPQCGYTAMNRYFTHLSTGQVKMIEEGVCHKFKGQKQPKEEPMEPYSYEKAIERYKLALYNTLVKKGKNSEQAYEGFLKAIASENFPMCGMEESTVNLLMANIAYKLGKVDIASRFISMILTSQAASRVAKDRAMLLKEEIIAKLHGKG